MHAGLLLLCTVLAPAIPPHRPMTPRPVGGVEGALRYKGCASAPGGAVVSVIGRDASVASDTDGHFQLVLPPGTYSLLINGPGLVPDQRVDEVAVGGAGLHDLGTVEVWPAERPPGCTPPASPLHPAPEVVAAAPDTPVLELPGATVSPAPVSPDQVWVRGRGGNAPGEFGLQGNPARDDEDALGPASFAVGPQGTLWVLDGLNRRVQRFDARGHLCGGFPVGGKEGEPLLEGDLALTDEGHVFLFTQGDQAGTLAEHDPTGRLLLDGALPPSFKGVDLLFTSRQRPLFLMLNGQAVRAELGWGGVRAEGPFPGLPAGGLYVHAERVDRWRAHVELSTASGRVLRSVQLHSLVPLAGVRMVGVARRSGDIVLALDRGDPAAEGAPRAEVLLLALDQHGHLAGTARAPPGGRRFEFREFALAPDGAVVQMQSDVGEVRFVRWSLRPPPRDAAAGEGLVRGRVTDDARLPAGASVAVPRLHRTVAVAADGTFELRLPAGTWLLSVRRGHGAAGADGPLELRVAVAPGATVDLGTVSLVRAAPRPPVPATPAPIGSAEPPGAPPPR